MGEVHGPYDAATWVTMGMLHRDIQYMEQKQDPKYHIGIKCQRETLELLKSAA